MVSVVAFNSDDSSLNPSEAYNFSVILSLKRTKINKKRPGLSHFLKIPTENTPVGGSITARLVSSFTSLNTTASIQTTYLFSLLVTPSLVILETSCTVVLPQLVSALVWFQHQTYISTPWLSNLFPRKICQKLFDVKS